MSRGWSPLHCTPIWRA